MAVQNAKKIRKIGRVSQSGTGLQRKIPDFYVAYVYLAEEKFFGAGVLLLVVGGFSNSNFLAALRMSDSSLVM